MTANSSQARRLGIVIRGARWHNLKNIPEVFIPYNSLTVVTGVSGSGKSSLIYDILYQESQRRFLQTQTGYWRFFQKSLVGAFMAGGFDAIEGLTPTVSLDQKRAGYSPRSTVGTLSQVFDYIRLAAFKRGQAHCPQHHQALSGGSLWDRTFQWLLERSRGENLRWWVLAVRHKKGTFQEQARLWLRQGFLTARIDGQIINLEGGLNLDRHHYHDIDLLVWEGLWDPQKLGYLKNLAQELEASFSAWIWESSEGATLSVSSQGGCPVCGFSLPSVDLSFFSFNSPQGWCPTCKGLGRLGVESVSGRPSEWQICPDCQGLRLRPEALAWRLWGQPLFQLLKWDVDQLYDWVQSLSFSYQQDPVSYVLKESLQERLKWVKEVGCGYLGLNQSQDQISGGELQRLRLAAILGLSLKGITYILDEPSIGLHPRNQQALIQIFRRLAQDHHIIVIEHDSWTMENADWIIELGPEGGQGGGFLLACEAQSQWRHRVTPTTLYLKGVRKTVSKQNWLPSKKPLCPDRLVEIPIKTGIRNLKKGQISIPLGALIGICGPSGSGKSSLVFQVIEPFFRQKAPSWGFKSVVSVNQRQVQKNRRSTVATYLGVAGLIRDFMATLPESRMRGFGPEHFSYNRSQGWCPRCEGTGTLHWHLPSGLVTESLCDLCLGQRYRVDVLRVKFRGLSIADIWQKTIAEAIDFFKFLPAVGQRLRGLMEVGLGYLPLGIETHQLSGGEQVRLKLVQQGVRFRSSPTIFILDEPTTGLHFQDVTRLLELFNQLVEQGHTIIIIEHHLDVLLQCQWLVELGPEGGARGGHIIFQGPTLDYLKDSPEKRPTGPFLLERARQLDLCH